MTPVIKTNYLNSVYEPERFKETVKSTVKRIRQFIKKNGRFDAIAFTGTSGAALAYIVANKLNVGLICVRKGDNSHYRGKVEGMRNANQYIIIDDFIDSGKTIKTIIGSVKKFSPGAKCLGIFLYDEGYDDMFEYGRQEINTYACG